MLALLATSSGQRGIIAWAEHHRNHHRHSDTPEDPHSPVVNSFWYAHFAWIWDDKHRNPIHTQVRDLTKFPELLFINQHHYIATYGLIGSLFVLGQYSPILGSAGMGLEAVLWGFMIPTLLTFQMTMSINSVYHQDQIGSRLFNTPDHSKNVWWMAIPSLGAAWHNNHHRYGSAARSGFLWWQIDISYYIIRALGVLGLVWDIREVPERVMARANVESAPIGVASPQA
jgi:stearoyl-CoA desaturase (delta-9 desaturase)